MRRNVALVTGGSSGVGEAVVYQLFDPVVRRTLADRVHAVHSVLAVGTNPEKLLRVQENVQARGGKLDICVADLTDHARVLDVFGAVDHLGSLVATVHCVGVGAKDASTIPRDKWDNIIKANYTAAVDCTEQSVSRMATTEGHGGDVVGVSSLCNFARDEGCDMYESSKRAAYAYWHGRARTARHNGVRVSVVNPGQIASPMDRLPHETDAEMLARQAEMLASNKILTPEDVAEAVVFNLTRRIGVIAADTMVFPLHQVQHY